MYETKISDAKWIFRLLCLKFLCGAAMLLEIGELTFGGLHFKEYKQD